MAYSNKFIPLLPYSQFSFLSFPSAEIISLCYNKPFKEFSTSMASEQSVHLGVDALHLETPQPQARSIPSL